jgi:hypothetical protein
MSPSIGGCRPGMRQPDTIWESAPTQVYCVAAFLIMIAA